MPDAVWERPDGTLDLTQASDVLRVSAQTIATLGLKGQARPSLYPLDEAFSLLVVDDDAPIYLLRSDPWRTYSRCGWITPTGTIHLDDEDLLLPLAALLGDHANAIGDTQWAAEEARIFAEIEASSAEANPTPTDDANDIQF